MDVQAHFSDIRDAIRQALDDAGSDITAAIAWLTDRELGEALIRAARRGCRVRLALLQDAINRREVSLTERLQAAGCRLYWIPDAGTSSSLHHKFCVIDHDDVITGSYNWTRRASRADENIVVVRGDHALATGYLDAFDTLLDKYGHADGAAPIDSQQLLRRLRVIHNLLLLDDHASVTGQLDHLQAARRQPAIAELIERLHRQDWPGALQLLDDLLAQGTALIVHQDPEITTLRLELRTLEAEVVALSSEQADLEQQINAFALRQHHALGEVLPG
jgi:phosphatidylserine/phosphatidylglycerophosphate/cardiolipin synthase-like enzyme